MFFLAISLISTFFLGNDPNEVHTSHRWRLLGGPYLGYCTWRRRVSGRQLVFFCERAAIFFMDTGEGAGDAGAAAVQNRVESHATSGVSPLGAWPCWSPWCSWQLRGWWHLFLQVRFAVKFPLVLMVMVLDFSAVGWLVSWVFESQLASFINHSWGSYFIQEKLQLTFVDLWFQSFSISSWFSNPFGIFRKGDCAFVGIYGEQDDFALVLLEDAEGDELSVTEELPSQRRFEVQKAYAAKEHVRDAPKLGTWPSLRDMIWYDEILLEVSSCWFLSTYVNIFLWQTWKLDQLAYQQCITLA